MGLLVSGWTQTDDGTIISGRPTIDPVEGDERPDGGEPRRGDHREAEVRPSKTEEPGVGPEDE